MLTLDCWMITTPTNEIITGQPIHYYADACDQVAEAFAYCNSHRNHKLQFHSDVDVCNAPMVRITMSCDSNGNLNVDTEGNKRVEEWAYALCSPNVQGLPIEIAVALNALSGDEKAYIHHRIERTIEVAGLSITVDEVYKLLEQLPVGSPLAMTLSSKTSDTFANS